MTLDDNTPDSAVIEWLAKRNLQAVPLRTLSERAVSFFSELSAHAARARVGGEMHDTHYIEFRFNDRGYEKGEEKAIGIGVPIVGGAGRK